MTDSARCANVLLLPFIFCTKLFPSVMQVDESGISSAGETFLSNSLASAALFVFHKDPSAFARAQGRGPIVGEPGHPSHATVYSEQQGSCGKINLSPPSGPPLWLFLFHWFSLRLHWECLQVLLCHLVVEFHCW